MKKNLFKFSKNNIKFRTLKQLTQGEKTELFHDQKIVIDFMRSDSCITPEFINFCLDEKVVTAKILQTCKRIDSFGEIFSIP